MQIDIPPAKRFIRHMYDVLLWVLLRHFYALEYYGFAGSSPIYIRQNMSCIVSGSIYDSFVKFRFI